MAACLPTLRSRVRRDTLTCLHCRDFTSVAVKRVQQGSINERGHHGSRDNRGNNTDSRDKLGHRVSVYLIKHLHSVF
jgi:hypothetical protein